MVGRFDKDGKTVQQYVTAGERSEPAVIQPFQSGLRRSPIAPSMRYSTSSKPISKEHSCPQVRFVHQRLRIIEPFQGSFFMSSTSQNLPTTRDYKSSMTNTEGCLSDKYPSARSICHAERSEASQMRPRGCTWDPSLLLRMTLYYSVAMNYSAKLRKSFELCNTLRHRFARRGATISFTYAIAWYDLCIYIQIIRYGVTVLQITVRWNQFFLETKDNNGITITK